MGSDASIQAPVAARLGYDGQLHEPMVGWQALGNGHRIYNPTLMRFHSPDALSPFDKGGINAYACCGGDPVNRVDPNGQFTVKVMSIGLIFTGVGSALGAARSYVHPEDQSTFDLVTAAMIIAGLSASVVGATYIFKKRNSKLPVQPVAEEAGQPTASPLTPEATSPPPGLSRQVTFAPTEQVTTTSRVGSTTRTRRWSDSDVGRNAGPRAERVAVPLPTPALAAPPAVSGARSGRRMSVATAGYKRTPPQGADKRTKRIRDPRIRKKSINSSNIAY